jgi:FG-GAP-like repeat
VADLVITDEGLGTNTIALGGPDAARFSVVGNELFLRAGTALDFETKPKYDITITVDDITVGATPDLTQAFTLAVTNVNEAPTALALTNPLTSINETTNTAAGVKIADIAVTDDALGDETFTLSGTDAASFAIRDVAGAKALFFIGTGLNAATKPTYAVTVGAEDVTLSPSTKVSAGLTLTIIGNNAAPTALALNNKVTTIAENSSTTARTKVADLAITDDGLGTNIFAIGGADAASFEISGSALYLKAGTTLNFETKPSYSITVNVDDTTVGATPDLTQAFTLSVTDVNEAPTALSFTPATLTLAENSPTNIKVADISLTDDALGTERFILSGSDSSSFEVRSVAGGQALFLTSNLDFESKPNYSVSVEAIDDTIIGSNPISKTFTLAVTNQNDPTTGTVTINGNPAPGNTLTSSNTLFDQDVIRIYAYQWQSSTDGINFTDITIANSASFSVTPNEAGKRLRLKLTTTDGLQNVTSTFSDSTGVIANTPVPPIPTPTPIPTPIPTPPALSVISTVATQTIAQWLPNLTTANYPSGSSYVITSDRLDLFEAPPTLTANGTLTYALKPGLEVNQTINITIQVKQPDGTINPTTTVRSTLNLKFRAEALVRNIRTEELGLLYIDQVNQIQGAKPITLGSNFGSQAGKSVPLNAQWQIIDTKDFNRDGIADILFQNRTLDEMAIWMMNSNGQIMDAKWLTGSDGQRLRTQNSNWKAIGFADIDGDRNLDIVWHNQQSDEIAFWFLQSDGFTVKSYDYLRDSSGAILKTKNPGWQLSKLGDFDGDGDTDLLFRLPELNQTAIIRLQGKTFVDAQLLGTIPDSSLIIRGVGDYNGDRIADIYWQTPQNDRVVVQPLKLQSGRWVSESFITIASGGNRPLQGIADLDRNSTDDLLFLDPTTNGLLAKPVEQANGAPTAVQQQGKTFTFSGTDWSIVQTDEFGDFV